MKHKKVLIAVIAILTASWLVNSCNKDESFEETQIESGQENQSAQTVDQLRFERDESNSARSVVLGEKRNNPFTIESINLAKTNLYGTSIPDKNATHKYVKFFPNTQDHIALLVEWEMDELLPLFGFPLEYEVISEGESYIDPSVSDSLYTYQYATVPNGVELPDVPYEVIDDLYLDKSDPLLLAESFWLTDNKEDINEYVFQGGLTTRQIDEYSDDVIDALIIPIVPAEPCPPGYEWVLIIIEDPEPSESKFKWECQPVVPPPPPLTNDCGCPILGSSRNPAGCVRVENDFGMVPVQIASIILKDSWFTIDLTFTDENGCWRVNESYSDRVWMWVQFRNANVKVRDIGYWVSLYPVTDYVGRFDGPPYNNISVDYGDGVADNTSPARRHWAAAHSLNTVNEYRNAAAADGVPLPQTDLNWTNAAGDGGAAAAMLQWHPFSSWPAFLAVWRFPLHYALSLPHLPDIVNQYDVNESAANFTGTGFHELGHASHYDLVGEAYWYGYRNHIINNLGYGTFGNFNGSCCPERVALGEAIGNFTGAIYGGTPAGGENAEWEDNFIPRGLMWDLGDDTPWDNVTDPNNGTTGPDDISGFTPNMIFNGLTPNVNDVRDFRDRLRALHLGDTPNNAIDFNTFVDIYDVFN